MQVVRVAGTPELFTRGGTQHLPDRAQLLQDARRQDGPRPRVVTAHTRGVDGPGVGNGFVAHAAPPHPHRSTEGHRSGSTLGDRPVKRQTERGYLEVVDLSRQRLETTTSDLILLCGNGTDGYVLLCWVRVGPRLDVCSNRVR